MTDETNPTRRQYLQTIGAVTIGGTAVAQPPSASAQTGTETLLDQDFETLSPGEFPSDWAIDGNQSQEVVASTAASGSQCLEQRGALGGCWQALANVPVSFPSEYPVRISGAVRPTDEGSYGCHDNNRFYIGIRTQVGSWSAGQGYRLLNFKPDGTVQGRTGDSTELGTYNTNEWNRFAIGYRPRNGEIEYTFRINGDESGPFRVDPSGFESNLSYLKLTSGDFVTQWDDLEMVRLPAGEEPLQQQGGGGLAGNTNDGGGGIPVLTQFTDSDESLGLGLLAVLGGVGAYAWYRSGSDNQSRRPGQGAQQVPPQQDPQYGSSAGSDQDGGQQRYQQPRQQRPHQQQRQTQRQQPQRGQRRQRSDRNGGPGNRKGGNQHE